MAVWGRGCQKAGETTSGSGLTPSSALLSETPLFHLQGGDGHSVPPPWGCREGEMSRR